jgi:nicotinic acid mononucleotide adenylyltransferase
LHRAHFFVAILDKNGGAGHCRNDRGSRLAAGCRHFDCWQRWRDIARLVPIAIIDRPGSTLIAPHGRAAEALTGYRRDETDSGLLAMASPPAFIFLHGPRSPMSPAALRGKPSRMGG